MWRLAIRWFSNQTVARDQAKQMLEEFNSSIFELKTILDWQNKIMYSKVPVILQCYAEWSNPCVKLKNILEKSAAEAQGKWAFAKLNIDDLPTLASALNVSLVPTLYLINRGNSIHKLEGMPDEETLQNFMTDVKLLSGLTTDEDLMKGLLDTAHDFIETKEYDNAISAYEEALRHEKWREKYEATCLAGLAKAHYCKNNLQVADDYINKLTKNHRLNPEENPELRDLISSIRNKLNEHHSGSKLSEYQSLLQTTYSELAMDPENMTHQAKIAAIHFDYGYPKEAIEKAFEIMELERSFKGEGHRVLMEIFAELGQNHELVKEARKKLQRLHIKYYV
jgi:thioredoxin-like negative regulator of GroEL